MRRPLMGANVTPKKGVSRMTELLTEESSAAAPDAELREEALRRLAKRRDFRAHLLAYVLGNALLWLIWGVVYAVSGFWFPWPVFPLFGWGIGLTFHAWDTYGRRPFREQDIDRELARMGANLR
jgi:hypothetical protein